MCKVLETKLDKAGIEYSTNTSIEDMKDLGIKSAPVLSVDGKLYAFKEAIEWLRSKN